MQHIKIYQIN